MRLEGVGRLFGDEVRDEPDDGASCKGDETGNGIDARGGVRG